MTYKEALRYLDSFIDYEKIGYNGRNVFKLEKMHRLVQIFGNPEKSFSAVHISGTKGKGSITAFISSILKEAGFKVGVYTSPHLISPRERIKINNMEISEEDFAFHASEIRDKLEKEEIDLSPTFFEVYTILAFNYFRAMKIELGVIEVGLGGRLDATNIVNPLVSVISPISYDHTHILGNSLDKIAFEKSGIIKRGCVCISAPQDDEALEVIREKCESLGVGFVLIGKDITFRQTSHNAEKEVFNVQGILGSYRHCVSYLIGRHQIENACCAVGIAESLKRKGVEIHKESIKSGIEKAKNPGRCETYAKNPYVILDGAQNRASAKALKETIKRNFNYKRLILVLGISKDKDIKGVCEEIAPLADIVILTKAKIERAAEPHTIEKFIRDKETTLTVSVEEAMKKARALATARDLILVTGSFFVVGEAKQDMLLTERRFSQI